MRKSLKQIGALALLSSLPLVAGAEVRFNGFLSAGGGILDGEKVVDEDTGKKRDRTYLEFDDDFSFDEDTIFGLQVTADLSERLSATGQIVAKGNDDYDVDLEWAFVTFQATDGLQARVGRLRAPFFMFSDFLEVGYAYPWIRPPVEVYGNIPFSGVDGLDAVYNHSLGDWDISLQAYYGRFKDDIELPGSSDDENSDVKNLTGITLTFNYDWLTLRGGAHRADVNIDLDHNDDFQTLIAGLRNPQLQQLQQLGVNTSAVADDLLLEDKDAKFFQIGAQIDYEDWLAIAEWTKLEFDPMLFQDNEGWYVTLGYRFGDFTLHGTYAEEESDRKNLSAPIPDNVPIPQLAPVLATLKGGVDRALDGALGDQSSYTLGLRWDFQPGVALKGEYQHIEDDTRGGKDADLFSFVVDVVF